LKLVVFDMDGTLLNGRVIFALSKNWGFDDKVKDIMRSDLEEYKQSEKIASLLKGLPVNKIRDIIMKIPLTKGVKDTVENLQKRGWILGIMSDSYTLATEFFCNKLKMDFHIANKLEEINGKLTGEVIMPLGWSEIKCDCKRSVCKKHHLDFYARHYGIHMSQTIAIGDNKSDLCIIRQAGLGIAFNPKYPGLSKEADVTITKPDMRELLKYL